jgi:hypothetical protein
LGPTAEEILTCQIDAWKETANEFEFNTPSTDRIQLVSDTSPRDAVAHLLPMDHGVDDDVLEEVTQFYMKALQKSSEKYLDRISQPKVVSSNENIPS